LLCTRIGTTFELHCHNKCISVSVNIAEGHATDKTVITLGPCCKVFLFQ